MLRKRFVYVLLVQCLFLAAAGNAAETQWWQLTLEYDTTSVRVLKAVPFNEPRKGVRTPGLSGAPLQISYNAIWGNATSREIAQTTTTLPIGWRTTIDTPDAAPAHIPPSGIIVVRLQGPPAAAAPTTLLLQREDTRQRGIALDDAPSSLQAESINLQLPKASPVAAAPGPISATKVRNTGPDSNRLVIAVMGDGYTASNLASGSFNTHTNVLLTAFANKPPYDVYFNATNVYRVDIESNESGADEPSPGPGIFRDTYLNSSFWTGGTERLLTINSTGRLRAINAADSLIGPGVWDDIFVLVNSTKYGGAGGSISVSSVHASANEIIIHEYGHTFAGLADEYDYGSSSPPASDGEPNVDFNFSGPGLKWLHWVEPGTPLPTPAGSSYGSKVGAFLGAKYSTTGVYRPWENCVMRALGRPFCPVCKEATAITYIDLLHMVDTQSPPAGTVQVGAGGVEFSVTPLPVTPVGYEWVLNGVPISGETTNKITIQAGQLEAGENILWAEVSNPTPMVRKKELFDRAQWTLTRAASGVDADIWSLY